MNAQRGFSLMEMALVLIILGFLLGGALASVSTLQARQRESKTEEQLDEIIDALTSFAAVNRRLPCPANPTTASITTGAGLERVPTGAGCTGGNAGVLPWATLGLPEGDAWARRFSYRVTNSFARSGTAITLASTGDNTVQNLAGVTLASQTPAVVVSHGANTRRSYGSSGILGAASPNAGETENGDADAQFVSDLQAAEFDDQVRWIPVSILMNRMLQAGTLP